VVTREVAALRITTDSSIKNQVHSDLILKKRKQNNIMLLKEKLALLFLQAFDLDVIGSVHLSRLNYLGSTLSQKTTLGLLKPSLDKVSLV